MLVDSKQSKQSEFRLHDLRKDEATQKALLAWILEQLASAEEAGSATLEAAADKNQLISLISQISKDVEASSSHIKEQVNNIIAKLRDKEKYPDEKASAKDLLKKSIDASELGYLGYVARLKYETLAKTLVGFDVKDKNITNKQFIAKYLAENPADADRVRQLLISLDENSQLESALKGSSTGESFKTKMKHQWESKSQLPQKPIEEESETAKEANLLADVKAAIINFATIVREFPSLRFVISSVFLVALLATLNPIYNRYKEKSLSAAPAVFAAETPTPADVSPTPVPVTPPEFLATLTAPLATPEPSLDKSQLTPEQSATVEATLEVTLPAEVKKMLQGETSPPSKDKIEKFMQTFSDLGIPIEEYRSQGREDLMVFPLSEPGKLVYTDFRKIGPVIDFNTLTTALNNLDLIGNPAWQAEFEASIPNIRSLGVWNFNGSITVNDIKIFLPYMTKNGEITKMYAVYYTKDGKTEKLNTINIMDPSKVGKKLGF